MYRPDPEPSAPAPQPAAGGPEERPTLGEALRQLVNSYSRENESDTPDFILSQYLVNALGLLERAVRRRDEWHGFTPFAALNAQPAAGGAGEVSQWEPIGTAPKDGTQVLLCRALSADGEPITDRAWGTFVQVAAWWENEDEEEGGEWVVYCSRPSEPRLHFEPSHWMPLPKNPLRGSRNGD